MTSRPDIAMDLLAAVDEAVAALAPVPPAAAARIPGPGKWSAAQVLGHLIDSAAHNHHRFVRARWQDDLVFEGYDQDRYVSAQDYQRAPWRELLSLWADYNRHLARLIAATPPAVRTRVHRRHNLHRIAWQPLSEHEPATLEWFFADYVGHLRHHLRQIEALVGGGAR